MDSSSFEQIDFYVHRDEELNLGRSQTSPCQAVKSPKEWAWGLVPVEY